MDNLQRDPDIGKIIEALAMMAPVLVGLQTQFDKRDDPQWYWALTMTTICSASAQPFA